MYSWRQGNTATISAVCVVMPYSTWTIPVQGRRYRSLQNITYSLRKDRDSWLPLETTSTRLPIRWTSSPLTAGFRSTMLLMSSFRLLMSCIISIKPSTWISFSSRSVYTRDNHHLPCPSSWRLSFQAFVSLFFYYLIFLL